jgi:hypothetical protein
VEGMKSKERRNNFDVSAERILVVNRKGREDAERIKNKEVCKVLLL